jgi:hypothetical protein
MQITRFSDDQEQVAAGTDHASPLPNARMNYALAGLEDRIFVAEYQVRLPTAERIEERLHEMAEESRGDESS